MTTDSTPSMRHFTTEAFGAGDRIAACHDVYGRTIAKIDLQPAASDEIMIKAKLRSLPGLGLVSMAGGLLVRRSLKRAPPA